MAELIIHDGNADQFLNHTVQDAHTGIGIQLGKGYNPRDYEKSPLGSYSAAPTYNVDIIPRSEWSQRIADMVNSGSLTSDLIRQSGIPPLNQQQTEFCFPAGTLIRMKDGSQKRIEDVKVLDEVLTAEGNIKKVLKTMVRHTEEEIHTIHAWGHYHLRATGEHPILTRRGYIPLKNLRAGDRLVMPKYMPETCKILQTEEFLFERNYVKQSKKTYRNYQEQPISKVIYSTIPGRNTGKYVVNALPDIIHLTHGFGRIIGFFLAEGHTAGSSVVFSFNIKEKHTFAVEVQRLFKKEFDVEASITDRPNNVAQVKVTGIRWARIFEELCGSGAGKKSLHPELTSGPLPFLQSVLSAWMDGDRQRGTSAVTISRELALNMFDIANSLGHMPLISTHGRENTDKHGVWHKHAWKVGWGDRGKPNHGTSQNDKCLWRKFHKITSEPFKGYVYNLEVEDDHSYVAEGIGVHNCWANAPVNACRVIRVLMGEPFVDLSPASVACPITGYRNQGGMGIDSTQYISDNGVCNVNLWPANAISRQYATAAVTADRANHRFTNWGDVDTSSSAFDKLISLLLQRRICPVGYNRWQHEILAVDPVEMSPGKFGVRIWNSWGASWGDFGFGILAENYGGPDDCQVCLASTISPI